MAIIRPPDAIPDDKKEAIATRMLQCVRRAREILGHTDSGASLPAASPALMPCVTVNRCKWIGNGSPSSLLPSWRLRGATVT